MILLNNVFTVQVVFKIIGAHKTRVKYLENIFMKDIMIIFSTFTAYAKKK